MQKIFTKNNIFKFFLFLSILSIPLYQIRIDFLKPSISLLSFFEIILIAFGISIYKNKLKENYLTNKYFYNLVLGLLVILLIAVLKTNTFHAYGIFIEWFILPILASFFILIYLKESKENILFLKKCLFFVFTLVNIIALFYWLKNALTYDGRLKAFYLSPNYLAMFISVLFFIVLSFLFKLKKSGYKIFLGSILFLSLIILFKTNSLINLFLVLVGLNIYFASFFKRRFLLAIVLLVTFLIIFFGIKNKIPDLKTLSEKNSIQSRLVIYQVGFDLTRDSFLIGRNVGNFQNEYLTQQKFYQPYPEWAVPTPHNFFIMNVFSAGLFFAILFYLICVYWIFAMFQIFWREKNDSRRKIVFLYLVAMLVFLFQGIFDTPYWKNDLSFIFWLTIVLGLSENIFELENKY